MSEVWRLDRVDGGSPIIRIKVGNHVSYFEDINEAWDFSVRIQQAVLQTERDPNEGKL